MVLTSELEKRLLSMSEMQKAALVAAPSTPNNLLLTRRFMNSYDTAWKREDFFIFPERSRMLHLKTWFEERLAVKPNVWQQTVTGCNKGRRLRNTCILGIVLCSNGQITPMLINPIRFAKDYIFKATAYCRTQRHVFISDNSILYIKTNKQQNQHQTPFFRW